MRTLILYALAPILVGCNEIHRENVPPERPGVMAAAPAASTPHNADLPVIVSIIGRQTVIIQSSPHGPLYTVTGKHGDAIVRQVTLHELQQVAPEIFQQIKHYRAEEGAIAGTWMAHD
jgi:hypothetical protein